MNIQQALQEANTWEARYRLIIQAGKALPRPSEETLIKMQSISGCEANLWFQICPKTDRTYHFNAYSEARIMNGLLAILLQAIENKSAEELCQFSVTAYFDRLGIAQRLSTTRLNGLKQIEQLLHQLSH